MKCELCNKHTRDGETVHGLKYGTGDNQHNVFQPAKDSAWTVICSTCGEMIYKLIYAKLNVTSINPTIYKAFTRTR